ncbi:MAG: DUF763 domain-containing protein [Treponema sp.]|nr:DUF763 domain-containing protein [Treponema sp.]
MIKSTGHADLPLHYGTVPQWLANRMRDLGTLIVESLILNYGRQEVLRRLSDPLWFQSLGAVLGMDWHSSGITTSVMYALKRGVNARAKELGLYICGGRGKYSLRTPEELLMLSEKASLDGEALVRSSKLCAKVDNTAVQDGFQLYQHNFILSSDGDWAVVQQGMNTATKTARRYHWCSADLRSFIEEPHSGVIGENQGKILNLTAVEAGATRNSIMDFTKETPDHVIHEIRKISDPDYSFSVGFGGSSKVVKRGDSEQGYLFKEFAQPQEDEIIYEGRNIVLPSHHEVQKQDVDLKRLGAVLATAYASEPKDFESLLLTPGLGPRTLHSLTLVSEVIHGTPSRFTDPARFSFAHGGKDGHPFPVPLKIYDESIRILHDSIEKSKMGYNEKSDCLNRLQRTALDIEKNCTPSADFDAALAHEMRNSKAWGGRTVMDD